MTVSIVRLADQQVRRDGLLVPGRLDVAVRNPAAAVLNQQLTRLRQLGRNLGLSPASRTMIGAAGQPDAADRDELDELFG
jgi:P27 family predicted phage terminase small subunit